MNTDTQNANESSRTDPQMNRRQMIKTIGAGAGVVALGSGAAPPLSSTATVQATGPCVEAVTGIGWWSGLKSYPNSVAECLDNETGDVDKNELLEDQLYETGVSVAQAQENFVAEVDSNYNISNADATPFSNSAWSEIRVRVARARLEGEGESAARDRAKEALNNQLARSYINITEKWNGAIKALAEQFAYDVAEGSNVDVFSAGNNFVQEFSSGMYPDYQKETITVTVDGTDYGVIGVLDIDGLMDNFPISTDAIDERDEKLELYTINVGDPPRAILPYNDGQNYEEIDFFSTYSDDGDYSGYNAIEAEHSSNPTETVVNTQVYYTALDQIETAYNNIDSNLTDYVSTLYDSFEEGALDPSTLLSPQDLYDNFANSSEQQRTTAELLAVGAAHPGDNVSFKAKVSHTDLQDPPQWGVLYPMFADGVEEKAIEGGITIPAADYKMAYLGFTAADTDEWTVRLLSGDSDLEILETENVDDDITSDREDQTAGTNGEVLVWDTASKDDGGHGPAPDPLKYPNDHGDWYIEVRGAENLSQHAMTAPSIQEGDNGQDLYVLDSTALNKGELIESIAIKQSANYTQTTQYVSDPTVIDSEKLETRLQAYEDLADAIEKLKSGVTGGGIFDGDLPSLPGLGFIESVVVVILAIFGLNAASG